MNNFNKFKMNKSILAEKYLTVRNGRVIKFEDNFFFIYNEIFCFKDDYICNYDNYSENLYNDFNEMNLNANDRILKLGKYSLRYEDNSKFKNILGINLDFYRKKEVKISYKNENKIYDFYTLDHEKMRDESDRRKFKSESVTSNHSTNTINVNELLLNIDTIYNRFFNIIINRHVNNNNKSNKNNLDDNQVNMNRFIEIKSLEKNISSIKEDEEKCIKLIKDIDNMIFKKISKIFDFYFDNPSFLLLIYKEITDIIITNGLLDFDFLKESLSRYINIIIIDELYKELKEFIMLITRKGWYKSKLFKANFTNALKNINSENLDINLHHNRNNIKSQEYIRLFNIKVNTSNLFIQDNFFYIITVDTFITNSNRFFREFFPNIDIYNQGFNLKGSIAVKFSGSEILNIGHLMNYKIKIGNTLFDFLISTSNNLKNNSILISNICEEEKMKLYKSIGFFDLLYSKNISWNKLISRISLNFSSSQDHYNSDGNNFNIKKQRKYDGGISMIKKNKFTYRLRNDIENSLVKFTDGCGYQSDILGPNLVFNKVCQIRYDGIKGLILYKNKIKVDKPINITKSMLKFNLSKESVFNGKLQISDKSRFLKGKINKEIFLVFLLLGVSKKVFSRFIDREIKNILKKDIKSISFNQINKIRLNKSALLFGVPDFNNVLNHNEIVVKLNNKKFTCKLKSFTDDIVITKNPCHSPMYDVQILNSVCNPIIYDCYKDLSNCIIFSTKGNFPFSSLIGTGDYDGDMYLVIWNKQLVKEIKKKKLIYMTDYIKENKKISVNKEKCFLDTLNRLQWPLFLSEEKNINKLFENKGFYRSGNYSKHLLPPILPYAEAYNIILENTKLCYENYYKNKSILSEICRLKENTIINTLSNLEKGVINDLKSKRIKNKIEYLSKLAHKQVDFRKSGNCLMKVELEKIRCEYKFNLKKKENNNIIDVYSYFLLKLDERNINNHENNDFIFDKKCIKNSIKVNLFGLFQYNQEKRDFSSNCKDQYFELNSVINKFKSNLKDLSSKIFNLNSKNVEYIEIKIERYKPIITRLQIFQSNCKLIFEKYKIIDESLITTVISNKQDLEEVFNNLKYEKFIFRNFCEEFKRDNLDSDLDLEFQTAIKCLNYLDFLRQINNDCKNIDFKKALNERLLNVYIFRLKNIVKEKKYDLLELSEQKECNYEFELSSFPYINNFSFLNKL